MIEFNKDTAEVIDNFFPEDLFEEVMDDVRSFRFTYGWLQGTSDIHGHFNVNIVDSASTHNLADVEDDLNKKAEYFPGLVKGWEYIKKNYVGEDKKLIRCYMNGHVYGVDGYLHKDSGRDDEWTAVFYCHHEDEWNPDWGGETVIIENGEITKAVLPKKNRAFIFAGNKDHSPRPLGRFYAGMRKVVVYKFRASRSEKFERVSSFLKDIGTLGVISKAGSNLHDHYMDCYNALYKRGFDEDLCVASALHSVYGSNKSKYALLDAKSESDKIKSFFSSRVETLVYLSSIIDRPDGLLSGSDTENGRVVKLFNGQEMEIPRDIYKDLLVIEASNQSSLDGVLDRNKYPQLSDVFERISDEEVMKKRLDHYSEHMKKYNKYVEYNIRKKKKNE